MTTRVKKHAIRLIIPFAYAKPFSESKHFIDPERFEMKDIEPDRLFDYAEHLISADENRHEAIGCRWVMRQKARKVYGLPHNFHHPISCRVKDQEWVFTLTGVELYLFETQVGLLQFHAAFPEGNPVDEQLEAVYYLKKLMNYSHTICFEQRTSKDHSEMRTLHFSQMAVKLLGPAEPTTFFEGKRDYPTEALVFHAVQLNRTASDVEKEIGQYLFHMRRSFKSTYKAAEEERTVERHPDLLRLFENSVWGISLEGLANIVTETEDSGTNHFFETQYVHHVSNTYAYLYLLVLHQKYALLHLSNEASHLTRRLEEYRDDPEEQNRLISGMMDRIVKFLLRSSYKQVSRSSHHSALYEWMRERLKIDDWFEELREAMEVLGSLTRAAEQKQRMEQEERKRDQMERFHRTIALISAIFLPLSVVIGIYSLPMEWLDPLDEPEWFAALFVGTYLFTYFLYRFWIRKED